MQQLTKGTYLGRNVLERRFSGLIISENQYQPDFSSEWHYHQNPYFALILRGGSLERRKKENIECLPGHLLYYNCQEPHKNEKYCKGSKNFSVEFEDEWFTNFCIDRNRLQGNMLIQNPALKTLFLKMLFAFKYEDLQLEMNIESLILQTFSFLLKDHKDYRIAPKWLMEVKDYLHETSQQKISLPDLAKQFDVHPVTISKLFPHFFHCTLGEYTRKIKIEKALHLLTKKNMALEIISYECGFADHAHFTRMFKKYTSFTPAQYRAFLFR
ncbi:MAG TPA: AraC family transcriptional regulator [Parafilimonas sp.]|nr:AraC family transcriptional regulator [Parafilimonas sp.]